MSEGAWRRLVVRWMILAKAGGKGEGQEERSKGSKRVRGGEKHTTHLPHRCSERSRQYRGKGKEE